MGKIKKRIGKTITFHWRVKTGGVDVPFDGRKMQIRLVDPIGNSSQINFTFVTGTNIADFTYQGKEQRKTGLYTIEMWENRGEDNQTVVDRKDAFELVRHSEDEGDTINIEGLDYDVVDLESSNLESGVVTEKRISDLEEAVTELQSEGNVRYDTEQELSNEQKVTARENIGSEAQNGEYYNE
jgi:hypothetical protein